MKVFSRIGKRTDLFLALLDGGRRPGAPPTPPATPAASPSSSTPRTGTGTWSGNNTPVFFIRDGIKFPDFIHSQKHDPFTNRQEPDNVWDFFSHSPGGDPPVHVAVRRPRHPGVVPADGRLRLAHLPVGQRGGRAVLGQVPLQDRPGHPVPDVGRGRGDRGAGPAARPHGPLRRHRAWGIPVLDPQGAGDARGGGGDVPLRPVRPHEGLALRGLSAHRRSASSP